MTDGNICWKCGEEVGADYKAHECKEQLGEKVPQLKPCPFCGEIPTLDADLIEHDYSNGSHVVYMVHHCFSGMEIVTEGRCWAHNSNVGNERPSAIWLCVDDWNNRGSESELASLRAEVETLTRLVREGVEINEKNDEEIEALGVEVERLRTALREIVTVVTCPMDRGWRKNFLIAIGKIARAALKEGEE